MSGRKPCHERPTNLNTPPEHARGGVHAELPEIETWENQYHGYEITITIPEFTCICPRTGLPDFGTITIHYLPGKLCLELKSLKSYIVAFRNIGIFNENAVNRILDDVARACKPKWAVVKGEFSARGGMRTLVEARYPRRAPSLSHIGDMVACTFGPEAGVSGHAPGGGPVSASLHRAHRTVSATSVSNSCARGH